MLRSRLRQVAAPHLPFRRLMLCLDCEECFEIGAEGCPRCGSTTWIPLARLLDRTQDRRRARARALYVVVVAPDKPLVHRRLVEAFADDEMFEVVVDRRRGDRRTTPRMTREERRIGDRRASRPNLRFDPLGWIIARKNVT